MFSMPRFMSRKPVAHNQRRRQFIDTQLQGGLLAALLVLEVAMLCLAMLYLYFRFSSLVDANLFTVHRSAQVPLLPEFLKQMGWVVLVMGLVNTLALLIAHSLWGRHIDQVIKAFRLRLHNIALLDLMPVKQVDGPEHRLIDLTEQWRAQEQRRMQQLSACIDSLCQQQVESAGRQYDQASAAASLQNLRRLLRPGAVVMNEPD